MPPVAQAALWGLLAGSGLLVGALVAVGFHRRLSHRFIAAVMGFGGGVLIAVLSAELMESAFREGGPLAATAGLLLGAATFSFCNWRLAKHGAGHRNRCGGCVQQPSEAEHKGARHLDAAKSRSRQAGGSGSRFRAGRCQSATSASTWCEPVSAVAMPR